MQIVDQFLADGDCGGARGVVVVNWPYPKPFAFYEVGVVIFHYRESDWCWRLLRLAGDHEKQMNQIMIWCSYKLLFYMFQDYSSSCKEKGQESRKQLTIEIRIIYMWRGSSNYISIFLSNFIRMLTKSY